MMALCIKARLCWGFSIKTPMVSKTQHAFSIPPPTTIIGAVTRRLAMMKGFGEVVHLTGESDVLASPTELFKKIFRSASAYIMESEDGPRLGKYWEDIVRYQIFKFQKPNRRMDPALRYNIVPSGKVYMPSGLINFGLLVREDYAEEILGKDWETIIIEAAYSVTNIGSKESIVSIEDVSLEKTVKIDREYKTRYYHPKRLVTDVLSVDPAPYALEGTYIERFWKIDYLWGVEPDGEEYIVPGSRDPIISCLMKIRLVSDAEAYKIGDDGLAVFE